jgi:hypothetical protein
LHRRSGDNADDLAAAEASAEARDGVTHRTTSNTVILRCSPFFTASLEGWATSACFDPSRRRASARLLRMTEIFVAAI